MALARMVSSLPAVSRTDVAMASIAVALGTSIAYIDSRPYWDDAGVTSFVLLVFAAFLGFLVPRRVWLWAIGIGVWVPLLAFVRLPAVASAPMFLVLVLTFAGAYGGRYLRVLMDKDQGSGIGNQGSGVGDQGSV